MPYAPCDVLNKREAEVYRITFEKEKELTDRALKLAEVGKPKFLTIRPSSNVKKLSPIQNLCIGRRTPFTFPVKIYSSLHQRV